MFYLNLGAFCVNIFLLLFFERTPEKLHPVSSPAVTRISACPCGITNAPPTKTHQDPVPWDLLKTKISLDHIFENIKTSKPLKLDRSWDVQSSSHLWIFLFVALSFRCGEGTKWCCDEVWLTNFLLDQYTQCTHSLPRGDLTISFLKRQVPGKFNIFFLFLPKSKIPFSLASPYLQ